VQTVKRMPTSRSTPREVLGPQLSRRKGAKAPGFERPEFVSRARPSASVSSLRSGSSTVLASHSSVLRSVASASKPSPRSTLARVLPQLTRAARLKRFERIARQLAFTRVPEEGASRASQVSRVGVVSKPPSGVAVLGFPPRVEERRLMSFESSSWRSLHDVVGTVLASPTFEDRATLPHSVERVRNYLSGETPSSEACPVLRKDGKHAQGQDLS
jgi:hypothetical protein